MLDRINFSDIYKFLSSIGLASVVTAILIPFFIFQSDLIKNYKDVDMKTLSDVTKQSIQYQDNAINFVLNFWWIFSGILFIAGIIVFFIGISKWKKRQAILDRLQDLDLYEKEILNKNASDSAINTKIEEDADEINESNLNKTSFIKNYKSIELKVLNAIGTNNPNIKIKNNAIVGNFVYDLIIIERLSQIERIHKICEVKYYQKRIIYSYLHHGISSFLLAVNNYKNNIANDDRRINLEFYMIWICTSVEQKNRLISYVDKAMKYSKSKGVNLKIIVKLDSEVNSLKNELL